MLFKLERSQIADHKYYLEGDEVKLIDRAGLTPGPGFVHWKRLSNGSRTLLRTARKMMRLF